MQDIMINLALLFFHLGHCQVYALIVLQTPRTTLYTIVTSFSYGLLRVVRDGFLLWLLKGCTISVYVSIQMMDTPDF